MHNHWIMLFLGTTVTSLPCFEKYSWWDKFLKYFWKYFLPYAFSLKMQFVSLWGPTQGHPTQEPAGRGIRSTFCSPNHVASHGATLTWRKGKFFSIKRHCPIAKHCIQRKNKSSQINVWFLLHPPIGDTFLWIAQVWHRGYHRLLQWLSILHCQWERQTPREKLEVDLIFGLKIIFKFKEDTTVLRGKALIIRD